MRGDLRSTPGWLGARTGLSCREGAFIARERPGLPRCSLGVIGHPTENWGRKWTWVQLKVTSPLASDLNSGSCLGFKRKMKRRKKRRKKRKAERKRRKKVKKKRRRRTERKRRKKAERKRRKKVERKRKKKAERKRSWKAERRRKTKRRSRSKILVRLA